MEKRLLFISKYKDIIQEFLDAMKDKDIEIETADNGLDAAALLKKNEYQITDYNSNYFDYCVMCHREYDS